MFDAAWRKQQIKKIIERYSNKEVSLKGYVELPPIHVIWLTALVNLCKREEENLFKPIVEVKGKFSPTRELIQNIFNYLHESGIIGLSNHYTKEQEEQFVEELTVSSKLGLYFKEADYVIDPYALYRHFPWKLTITLSADQERQLFHPLPGDFQRVHRYLVWKVLNAHEALELFRYNTETAFGESKNSLTYLEAFEEMLDRFSLAQLAMLIHFQTNQVLRQEKEGKGKGGSERVMKAILKYVKGREGDSIGKFEERPFACPQSVLSRFIYNEILGIGDDGYVKVPNHFR